MKQPRIVIAAPASGTGKTTVTCALLEALRRRHVDVCSFKCGPDYIDPLYHRQIIGIPSGNLDLFFTDEPKTKSIFFRGFRGSLAVIEGVMGLYDGLGGIREEASTYHLAQTLDAPIILVVNAQGVGRSVLAQIRGMLEYDHDRLIRGVILNRVSASFGQTLAALIEEELCIEVLGFLPNRKRAALESRHLGLVLPSEVPTLRENLGELAAELEAHVNVNRIVEIAEGTRALEFAENAREREIIADQSADFTLQSPSAKFVQQDSCTELDSIGLTDSVRIAVAHDEAFCFYYRENLDLLRTLGAEIIYFSPLRDRDLPENIAGILIGGGYPELHLQKLSSNHLLKTAIFQAADSGMPIRAECGGFMYLGAGITAEDSAVTEPAQETVLRDSMALASAKEPRIYPMVGLHSGVFARKGMTGRFGYITLTSKTSGKQIRAHEFHYYDCVDSEDCGGDYLAKKPVGGKSWGCMVEQGNIMMGFPHLYYPSNLDYAREFIAQCRTWKQRK